MSEIGINRKSRLIRHLMTGDGTDAASESNGNLFTLPSREEENDKVVNRDKPWSIEMLVPLVALCDYRPKHKQDEDGGRRLALAITDDPLAVGRGRVPLIYTTKPDTIDMNPES